MKNISFLGEQWNVKQEIGSLHEIPFQRFVVENDHYEFHGLNRGALYALNGRGTCVDVKGNFRSMSFVVFTSLRLCLMMTERKEGRIYGDKFVYYALSNEPGFVAKGTN